MKKFLSIKEASEFLGVSSWTIRAWVRERKVRSLRFGHLIKLEEKDLLAIGDATSTYDIDGEADKIIKS